MHVGVRLLQEFQIDFLWYPPLIHFVAFTKLFVQFSLLCLHVATLRQQGSPFDLTLAVLQSTY